MIPEILTILGRIAPKFVIFGIFVSWLIWAKCFNQNKLGIKNVNHINQIFSLFILITYIFLSFLIIFFLIYLLILYDVDSAISLLNNYKDYIIILYLFLFYIFISKKFTKKYLSEIIDSCRILIFSFSVLFVGMGIGVYFSAFQSLTSSLIFIGFISFVFFSSSIELFSRLFKDNKKETSLNIKTVIFIVVFVLFIAFIINLLSLKTTTDESNKYYIIDPDLNVKIHKDINTNINQLSKIPFYSRLHIKYTDLDIKDNERNPDFRIIIDIQNKSSDPSEFPLSQYIDSKGKFINGLKFIKIDYNNNEIIFEINRSELINIEKVSIIGFKRVGQKWNIDDPNRSFDNASNIWLNYTVKNNKIEPILPIKLEDYYLYNLNNLGFSNCKLKSSIIFVDNNSFELYCDDPNQKQCFSNPNNPGVSIFFDDTNILHTQSEPITFSVLKLNINAMCD